MMEFDERMKILSMLQEGKISVEEATALLDTLEKSYEREAAPTKLGGRSESSGHGRWLRVKVSDSQTGQLRVNVRLPIELVASGIRFGLKFSPEVQGLDIDELSEWIKSGTVGQIVDVLDEQDGEHVEVFVE